jgi:hypothetical protein
VPLTEESPLRTQRYVDGPAWENLDVEEAYLGAGATILRLGVVYGEHDCQRRFEPVLRRVRAGRRRAVAWHLRHPPDGADSDFSADDAALAVVL